MVCLIFPVFIFCSGLSELLESLDLEDLLQFRSRGIDGSYGIVAACAVGDTDEVARILETDRSAVSVYNLIPNTKVSPALNSKLHFH